MPFTAQDIDHKQVCRLDVTVDDALGVSRSQGRRGLLGKRDHLGGRQAVSTGFGEILLQRDAAQQFHHQVWPPILFPGVVNRADVGMVQRGRRTRLAQETFVGEWLE